MYGGQFSPSTIWVLGNQTQVIGFGRQLSHIIGPPEDVLKNAFESSEHISTDLATLKLGKQKEMEAMKWKVLNEEQAGTALPAWRSSCHTAPHQPLGSPLPEALGSPPSQTLLLTFSWGFRS